MAKAYRTVVPQLDKSREAAAAVNGPVVTRVMTPEERERNKPNIPDKVKVLELVAAGKSINKIEKEWELGQGTLVYWLGKWGWKGLKPDRAKQLLDEMLIDRVAPEQENHDQLKKQLEEEVKQLRDRIVSYEHELGLWAQRDSDSAAQLAEVTAERDLREQELLLHDHERADLFKQLNAATVGRDNWVSEYATLEERYMKVKYECNTLRGQADELKQAVAELQEERQLLLETIEQASTEQPAHDNVNRPAHYTAGGIETIDYMQAKMSGDEFAGYCRGNVIKYISHAPQKNGVEDYRKAAWYLDRLIGAQ